MWRLGAVLLAVAAFAPAAARTVAPGVAGIGYICSAERIGGGSGPRALVRAEGVGNSRLPADTRNPEAQAWFDYGLQLADGFYHEDAKLAFAKAVSLDPTCATCLWGEAWARGDNLNIPASPAETEKAKALLAKASALPRVSERDRAILAAFKLRYAGGDDHGFARAMEDVARRYPDQPELAVIAAQGWMLGARDDDRSGIEPAIQLLDGVLKRQPDHAGAIHFYIHATEFAGRPAVALPFARKLPALAPTASHLVHMPAHTLFRVGRYEDAGLLNARALGVEAKYRKDLNAPGPLGGAQYYTHNFAFGLAGAMMAGDGPLAVKFADHVPLAYPMTLPPEQRDNAIGRSYVAYGRFAPDRAMALPDPGKDRPTLAMMRFYAQGEAAAARGDVAAVRAARTALGALKVKPSSPYDRVGELQTIAGLVLDGRAAMLSGDTARAVGAYAQAADLQDDKLAEFFDPPPWWYPVRRSLAAALLKRGQYADAAAEARRSLAGWPEDAIALRILADAERAQGQRSEAAAHAAQSRRVWQGADPARLPLALV